MSEEKKKKNSKTSVKKLEKEVVENVKKDKKVEKIEKPKKDKKADKPEKVQKPKKEKKEKPVKKLEPEIIETPVEKTMGDGNTEDSSLLLQKGKKEVVIKAPRIISKEENATKEKKHKKHKNEEIVRYNPGVKIGLTADQVAERIENKLQNVSNNKNTKTYKSIILGNIFTFFNMLCFLVAGALIAVGAWTDCFFLVIVLANTLIGIIQEIKAKKTVEKISLVSSPMAMVVRDKIETKISVSEVVLDDIIVLQTGKQICADCIIMEGSIEVNESLLTGESVPIKKGKGDMLFSGSFVVSGKCSAKVEKVGGETYTAKLAAQAKKYQKPKSELMGTLNTIIKIIGVVIIPLAILMFLNNYDLLGNEIPPTVKQTAGSVIGMIPSGMFLLTSVALAVGVVKLIKKRTLVQDLYSIEMLARTDVLCLDKTGTITDGTMKVSNVIQIKTDMKYTMEQLIGSMLTALDDNNMTSRALISHFGYSKELTAVDILPFSSSRKLSAVTFKSGETYVFGAPEYVLKTKHAQVDSLVKNYASKGFRVLLFAECDGAIKDDKLPAKREPVALVVIEDHIREDAPETIEWFKNNGVEVKIISGDNPVTVSEVSRRVGVENSDRYISLEGLSQQQVIDAADQYTVFGRVSPEQKCILVKALKAKGHKVAMTGDGVNDILALKEADCSVAMASGSEATRHVSNLVLLDSNFSSMPDVVAEGRRVINNIQKSSSLFLMKTIYTILLSIFFLIVKDPYPFSPKQVLLLELFVIGIPSFFLALQPNNDPIKGKFLTNLLSKSLPGSLILFISVIGCYLFNLFLGTNGQYETMAALCVTFVGLLVLFRICKPFDVFRGIMFTAMVICCAVILSIESFFAFFEFTQLSLQNILFIICLVEISYPCYDVIVKTLDKVIYAKKE